MKKNTAGLKKDLYRPLEQRLNLKMEQLPDIAVKFLRSTKKKIRTQNEYAKDLSLFFDFLVESGKVKVSTSRDITPEHIESIQVDDLEDFIDHLEMYKRRSVSSKGKEIVQTYENGPSGIARKRATLKRFYAFLVKRDFITKDPTKKLEDEASTSSNDIKERLKPDEVQRFFDVILNGEAIGTEREKAFHEKQKYRDYIISLILAYTGIRVGELVQLDIDDISIQRGHFDVLRKGGKKERITMPTEIIDQVSTFLEERKAMKDVKSDALFVSLRKTRMSDRTIREMLYKYEQRSGIDIHITPHLFRRTFGTTHYNENQDMYLTAKVMGHTSAETTRKFYADPSKEREVRSMSGFGYGKTDTPPKDNTTLERLAEKYGIPIEELRKEMKA